MGNIDGQIRRIRVQRKGGRNRLVVRSVLFFSQKWTFRNSIEETQINGHGENIFFVETEATQAGKYSSARTKQVGSQRGVFKRFEDLCT
jgi:hypothetical protein